MPSPKYQQVVDFLIRNLAQLSEDGGSGSPLDFPDFELMPFDYLEFAEEELEQNTPAARINCVAHLKRAVECELDTLLGVLNLSKQVQSFPKKLEFAGDVGIVSPRSLAKLNKMRNRMEHEYAIPEAQELEVYFDLASSFVHTLEGYIFMLYGNTGMSWRCRPGNALEFGVTLDGNPPRVLFELVESGVTTEVTFEVSPLSEYCEGLKIYFLMCRATALISKDYVLSKLTGTPLYASGRSQ
jgi:hypothetical protein